MIRKKTAPSYRLICVVLAVVLLLALAVPGLAEHQWSNQIHSFERTDPVYDETVELGTARDALHLPDTLRAIVGIPEEMDVSTFLQAAPEADTSDGSESFDYYWYGYVAPKGADALVEAGEKAIYTIYYANGDLAYRLYGSIEGSENLWFACDEAGNITGAVLDIPVEWSGSYDGETAGTYTFTARVSGESSYHWSGSAPTASIYVAQDDGSDDDHSDEPVCTCGAQPDENGVTLHAEDCPCYTAPEPVCTCGAQPDENGVTVHAEDCPCYTASEPVCTCGAQPREDGAVIHAEDCPCYVSKEIHCTCTVGEDVVSSDHDASCPFYQAALLCTCGLATNEPSEQHAEDCPCYVLPLTDCHCGLDGEPIAANNYPWAHQADCKYFSPIECMCREQIAVEVEDYDGHTGEYLGTRTEYIPGEFTHIHDPANRDCLLYGKDTVRIVKLNTGEESVMSVEDAERLVAYQNTHGASDRDIYTVARDPEQEDAAQEGAENAAQQQESTAAMYPALGCISIIAGSEQTGEYDPGLVLYASGANETQMDSAVERNVKTDGNKSVQEGDTWIPSTWRNYVNTRFRNQYDESWAWASPSAGTPKWDGTTSRATIGTGNLITVSTPQQLRWALTTYGSNKNTLYTIKLNADMDMNGAEVNWESVPVNNLILDGQGHTLYNLGCFIKKENRPYLGFMHGVIHESSKGCNVTVTNLNILSAKIVYDVAGNVATGEDSKNAHAGYGGIFIFSNAGVGTVELNNIHVKNSMVVQTSPKQTAGELRGAIGVLGYISKAGNKADKTPRPDDELCKVTACSVENSVAAGLGHPGGMLTFINGVYLKNSGGANNTVYSMVDAHGGLLCSCSSTYAKIENCFASGEMYAQSGSGGLTGQMTRNGSIVRCFATGKLEASRTSAGFTSGGGFYEVDDKTKEDYQYHVDVKDCYTTVLVGLRSDNTSLSGFIGSAGEATVKNSYAAGEVGDFTTDLTKTGVIGGFTNSKSRLHKYENCYYDKQTTGMREWWAGNSNTPNGGVIGLLTKTSDKNKAANGGNSAGMASGQNFGLGPKENGVWSYSGNHYPQLQVFSGASKDNGWGTEAMADLAKAVSSASTATVLLNTWEEGYDWDENGVRTKNPVSYSERDGEEHKAGKYTYDTVREIISPFTVTSGTWKELIPGGAKTRLEVVGGTSQSATTKNIVIEETNGTVKGPGMNWFSVSEKVGNETASRPLRLIGYMSIDAGDDRTVKDNNPVKSGTTYDHRKGVTLTMMNEIKDNLVVGINDKDFWSTAKRAGYPTVSNTDSASSPYYYGVPTDHTNHLKTNFSASIGAILNTEIWRVAKTADGKYAEDENGQYVINCSVKVTGEGTSGASGVTPTEDEMKWNGIPQHHFFVDENQLYEVSYYWQLADGRYVTDSKWVEVIPTTRYLTVEARGGDGRPTDSALYLEAYRGEGNIDITSTAARAMVTEKDIPVAEPSTAVWKKTSQDSELTEIIIQLKDNDEGLQGTTTIRKETIDKVKPDHSEPVWFSIQYYYTTDVNQGEGSNQEWREESLSAAALVRYDLCVTKDGTYYIKFNRSHKAGDGETDYVRPLDGQDAEDLKGLNFKDMHYNVRVVVKVEENAYVQVKKVVSNYTEAMADQTFTINLTRTPTDRPVAQVNLKNGETSKVIKVPIIDDNKIKLTEVLPMEFQLESLTFTQPEGSKAVLTNDGTLTLHAGDRVTLIVHNTYTGQGYFKSRTQENNTFLPAS